MLIITLLCAADVTTPTYFAVTGPAQVGLSAKPTTVPLHMHNAEGMDECYWVAQRTLDQLVNDIYAKELGLSPKQKNDLIQGSLELLVACVNHGHDASLYQLYNREGFRFRCTPSEAKEELARRYFASRKTISAPFVIPPTLNIERFRYGLQSQALQKYLDYRPSALPDFIFNTICAKETIDAMAQSEKRACGIARHLPIFVYSVLAKEITIDRFLTALKSYYLASTHETTDTTTQYKNFNEKWQPQILRLTVEQDKSIVADLIKVCCEKTTNQKLLAACLEIAPRTVQSIARNAYRSNSTTLDKALSWLQRTPFHEMQWIMGIDTNILLKTLSDYAGVDSEALQRRNEQDDFCANEYTTLLPQTTSSECGARKRQTNHSTEMKVEAQRMSHVDPSKTKLL